MGNNPWFFASSGFERLPHDNYLQWNLECAYAVICVTAFTLPLAERTQLIAYLVYAFILAGFVYPAMVAWIWGDGWLAQKGFHDFAGSGVIHMVAGLSAFWGIVFVGERYGKDKYNKSLGE
jgi:Amt family ammonium transporter